VLFFLLGVLGGVESGVEEVVLGVCWHNR
jgi:hypothetical protein